MHYAAELAFFQKTLKKLHLRATEISVAHGLNHQIDFGLRSFLGREKDYARFFCLNNEMVKPNTIYKLTDNLRCRYIYLQLPHESEQSILVVGPYLTAEIRHEQLLEIAEQYGVLPGNIKELEGHYTNIPVLTDEVWLFTMINILGESLWGSGTAFEIVDINQEITNPSNPLLHDDGAQRQRNVLLDMQTMEMRYAFENELMDTVACGQSHRAALMVESFSTMAFEQRMSDPIRNAKNYCIICNTLLRKAAEQGGVHPVYLDKASSDFARKIEALKETEGAKTLMADMITSYCRLVRKHAMKQYSPPVQKTLAYIDADLSGDLSLHTLASIQGISGSYLSARFKKETGQTITDYVNEKRVQKAKQLLSTTKLQIQTIAQYCGISDVNYFSKIFKKYADTTPKEYRKDIITQIAPVKKTKTGVEN